MTTALAKVASLIQDESGIRFAASQHPFIQAALGRVGPDRDPQAFLRRAADPATRRTLIGRLIDEVTVKETSFLRDRQQLGRIDWKLLLQGARAAGAERLRVWAAPCATGEEAYSLALLACEAFAPAEPPVTIFASDISALALARARAGVYDPRAVRDLDSVQRDRFFRRKGQQLVVGEQLRSLVTFAAHNLTRDPFPPLGEAAFQLILCRNVLIYFNIETVAKVLASLERALTPNGTLVLGVADVLCQRTSRLAARVVVPPPTRPTGGSKGPLRRPLGRLAEPPVTPTPWDEVMAHTSRLLAEDPLNSEAHFHRGLAQLERGDPLAAVSSLRRALYVDAGFGLASFTLGSAHEALGERTAARRAYEQALRTLQADERHQQLLGEIDVRHVTAAAGERLQKLSCTPG
jgi:chemotaxis methyl-accepting protein methylase